MLKSSTTFQAFTFTLKTSTVTHTYCSHFRVKKPCQNHVEVQINVLDRKPSRQIKNQDLCDSVCHRTEKIFHVIKFETLSVHTQKLFYITEWETVTWISDLQAPFSFFLYNCVVWNCLQISYLLSDVMLTVTVENGYVDIWTEWLHKN